MGDNVARCFMCKYDFQKASRDGEDVAKKEATEYVKKVDQEASNRVAERKAEEEKFVNDAKERNRIELASLQQKLEEEKLRLESEYVELRKKALEERGKLEKDLASVRKSIEDEKAQIGVVQKQRDDMIVSAQADAKIEAEKILQDAEAQTKSLAIQVQKEYAEAMKQKQLMLDEAARAEQAAKGSLQKAEDANRQYEEILKQTEEVRLVASHAQEEAVQIIAKAKEDAIEEKKSTLLAQDAKIKEAEEARNKVLQEVSEIQSQIDATRASAESELNLYITEAKKVIASADEAANQKQLLENETKTLLAQLEKDKESAVAALEAAKAASQIGLTDLHAQLETAQSDKNKLDAELEALRNACVEEKANFEKEKEAIIEELEMTRRNAQGEIDQIVEEVSKTRESAQNEANALKKELEDAQATIKSAASINKQAVIDGEKIILEAEKKAVSLKEAALNEGERGQMQKQIDELTKLAEERMAAQEAAEKLAAEMSEKALEALASIKVLQAQIDEIKSTSHVGSVSPISVPMEYEVELVSHLASGEVDYKKIQDILKKRGPEGWKLHSLVNDEGGRLQASIGGGNEKFSLSSDSGVKEDRVILIFERVVPEKVEK